MSTDQESTRVTPTISIHELPGLAGTIFWLWHPRDIERHDSVGRSRRAQRGWRPDHKHAWRAYRVFVIAAGRAFRRRPAGRRATDQSV